MENSAVYKQINFALGYVQLFIGLIGLIGNVLVIVLFSRRSLSKYSYSFYCRAMAISDSGIMTFTFLDWASFNLGANLETTGPLPCKIVEFFHEYFVGVSIFLLTIIAIDRMLAIVYPKRFIVLKKRWVQYLVVVTLAFFVLLTCIIVPLNTDLIEFRRKNSTELIRFCLIQPRIANIQMWVIISIYIGLNIIINNFLNIKTVRFIMGSRRRVATNGRNSSLSSRDRKFAVCSVSLNLAAMILKMSLFITLIIANYSNISFNVLGLLIKITGLINYIDNGSSFFINLFFNSLFYHEFLKLFRFRR